MPTTMLSLGEIMEPAAHSFNIVEETDHAESIRRAVLALPEKYRDAVIVYYFHEQDVPAAALTLGIPEGTLKARLFRGRELLRRKFSQVSRTKQSKDVAASSSKEAR